MKDVFLFVILQIFFCKVSFSQIDTTKKTEILIRVTKANKKSVYEDINKLISNGLAKNYTSMTLFGDFDTIPSFIGEFINICDLSIDPFHGVKLTDNLNSLKKIFSLRILGELNGVSDSVKLPTLEIFEIASSLKFPNTITNWYNLKRVEFSSSRFKNIPIEITKLKSLEELILCNDVIKSLPDEIIEFSFLRILSLKMKNLTVLPANLCDLKSLKELYVLKKDCPKLKLKKEQTECLKKLPGFERLYR